MNNLKNFFSWLRIKMEAFAFDAFNFVANHHDFMDSINSRAKLYDCLNRANNAYYALTRFSAPKAISVRQLEEIIMYSSTYDALRQNLEDNCSTKDSLYILLLAISIANVYKPTGTPQITFSVDKKYLN